MRRDDRIFDQLQSKVRRPKTGPDSAHSFDIQYPAFIVSLFIILHEPIRRENGHVLCLVSRLEHSMLRHVLPTKGNSSKENFVLLIQQFPVELLFKKKTF